MTRRRPERWMPGNWAEGGQPAPCAGVWLHAVGIEGVWVRTGVERHVEAGETLPGVQLWGESQQEDREPRWFFWGARQEAS